MNLATLFPGSIWLYLGTAVAIATVSGGATYAVKDAFDKNTIKDLKLEAKDKALQDATAALSQFEADSALIHGAAQDYQSLKAGMDAKFAALTKDFRDATRLHPLPVDCKPDDFRVRAFYEALDAINNRQPSTTRPIPSGRLPAVAPARGR